MTTVELRSVSMGPLSDMLEQWWAKVEVTGDGLAPTVARLSISWSPVTNRFGPEGEETEILSVGDGPRAATVAEVVAAFEASPARGRAYAEFRDHACRHRDDFPERVARMRSGRAGGY